MDENKICFIWNVHNENYYQESAMYVDNLVVPDGITIEKVIVSDKNFAKAYNIAMKQSNAKYKVYLYDSLFLLNKNFIVDILNIFENSEVAILGVLGSKVIPTSGVWQDSRNKVGKQYLDNGQKVSLVSFGNIEEEKYIEVKVLDGSILVTQQDIQWREDLFIDKYFFDSAQCIEFVKKGYKVAVVNQKEPWSLFELTENENKVEFDIATNIFLVHYSKDIFPLVSILIPTYNRPEYFKIALESAINQTYRNIEIVIADNSTNEETKKVISSYLEKYDNIRYFNNGGNIGIQSVLNLVTKSSGEYINYLMDDDVFHLEKIRVMMNFFIEYDNIALVTSYRQLIDEKGNFLPDRAATQKIVDNDSIIDGKELGRFILFSTLNVIGEPTTVLMKKETIKGSFGIYLGRQYRALVDIAQWLEAMIEGNVVYLTTALSFFRQHQSQEQKRSYVRLLSANDSFEYLSDSYKSNIFIDTREEYLKLINDWYKGNVNLLKEIENLKKDKEFEELEFEKYLEYIEMAEQIIS
ncbi:Glycosyltransferases involved in cell wall biogenesis [Propionispora hippei DSM 15287]|uniref:Glycosyltransferases involved in cell wall biogenesis n=1 Tax=Propionispora hippei DSM 15287 TaxID=1123003 RepID=A0A1M6FH21_9FIRM|nr:glycosyltransferase [Propionispora hippei]SHI96953.1 Glycosyltransferases involved in cell wall biogenesis [Propionispora hippei DSM 15287]